jgi:hypothetical protein
MIRGVVVRGRKVTIDWDQSDYDFFFRAGLQLLADEHFGGKRRVIVVDPKVAVVPEGTRRIDVSDGFADAVVGHAVNQALREHLDRLDLAKRMVKPILRTMFKDGKSVDPRPFEPPIGGVECLVHKAVEKGRPDTICGVKRPKATSLYWKEVNCPRCRKASRDGIRQATSGK